VKRQIEVTLVFEIDDQGQHISEEEFAEGIVECLDDQETMRGDDGEDYYSDISDYFGFTVYGAKSVTEIDYPEGEDDGDEESDEA